MSTATSSGEAARPQSMRYVINVLWTWTAVAVSIVAGLLVSPYIIRKIGDANFGIWTLALSLVEYYWLIDLGLRSATMKMSTELHALGQRDKMNVLISTGVTYSMMAGVVTVILTLLAAPRAGAFFHVTQPEFPKLILIAGFSWSLGLVFNILSACLDGLQRFDIFGRILTSVTLLRSISVVIALSMGYGLLEMGYILLASQMLIYLANFVAFRRVLPWARVSWSLASYSMLKEMMSYGIHTLTTGVAERLRSQSVPALIIRFLPVEAVTYFTVPTRIMEYAMNGIGRVGTVTAPNATEMATRGQFDELVELGVYTNRYCLSLFLPLTAFLMTYGYEIYSLWIRPEFAAKSAYLLPILLFGNAAIAGQYNSVSILFGIGRHKRYSQSLLAEAILTIIGMIFVLPRYGLMGGAILVTTLMILIRGVGVCVLLSRELRINPFTYGMRIYAVPTLIGIGALLFSLWLKREWIPGHNWGELILAATLMMIPYVVATYSFTLDKPHRELVRNKVRTKFGFATPTPGAAPQ